MTEELPASKLGTKEHWDMVYARETGEFEDTGDEGEVWFGESAVNKMVDWAFQYLPPNEDGSGPTVMEAGCGNGTLLLSILYPNRPKYRRRKHYTPARFTGIDYSELSVELSQKVENVRRNRWNRRIASDRQRVSTGETLADSDSDEEDSSDEESAGESESPEKVSWFASDLLTCTLESLREQSSAVPLEGWDLIVDKGTYDAIALSQEPVESGPSKGKLPSQAYPDRIASLVKEQGFFLITSCNFTEEEIKSRFSQSELGLEYHSTVKHPSFSFGGKTGTTVCTVGFRKRSSI